MSIISDNRRRIATRVEQLESGRRYAQAPPSRLRRIISNIDVLGAVGGEGTQAADTRVEANFVLVEARERGTNTWAGRTTYHLRPELEGFALSYKKVDLVDREWVLPTLAFII
jgi:3-phenylpropionate/cinnamic acid dioxygenase small subunit